MVEIHNVNQIIIINIKGVKGRDYNIGNAYVIYHVYGSICGAYRNG